MLTIHHLDFEPIRELPRDDDEDAEAYVDLANGYRVLCLASRSDAAVRQYTIMLVDAEDAPIAYPPVPTQRFLYEEQANSLLAQIQALPPPGAVPLPGIEPPDRQRAP